MFKLTQLAENAGHRNCTRAGVHGKLALVQATRSENTTGSLEVQ